MLIIFTGCFWLEKESDISRCSMDMLCPVSQATPIFRDNFNLCKRCMPCYTKKYGEVLWLSQKVVGL